MRLLDLPASRLQVVHEGGWMPAANPAADAPAMAPLPADYFLFVGSLEPGKNLALLREIYLATRSTLPPLVLVGERWKGVAHEGAPPGDWRFFGRVSDLQLAALYRGARALLFPSKYEGFGLPVLEAMTHGCPVLCGPVASLPEIAGDAAAFADLTAESYGAAMRRLMDDHWRAELIAAGLERSSQFSWEKCAQETLEVYREITKA
jgi:alpha-1,3-rhamnosyl/mannosyltransferase